MLRNRSRAVTTKQALMADNNNTSSLLSPTKTPSSPISSFLNSPRFFNGFLNKNLSDKENIITTMSPTSILDTKNSSSCFVNPFGYDTNLSKPRTPSPESLNSPNNKQDTEAIGLALIDSIIEEKSDWNDGNKFSKPINRMALLGSKLKVQIPDIISNPTSEISPVGSPKSPADFGIKTRNSQFLMSPVSIGVKDYVRQLSLKEMEMSEDYTCVISHGPNPKTTHIFDDCIVERCCLDDDDGKSCEEKKMDCGFGDGGVPASPKADFLSFCHTCKDVLGQGKDIYMYRGEKAFCSHECRCQEMLFDGMKNSESDDAF